MSRMTREVTAQRKESIMQKHPVTNFIGSTCYQWNPVDTLKMITASSVFGEPAYYRDGEFEDASVTKIVDGIFSVNPLFKAFMVPAMEQYSGMKTSEVMEQAIDRALDYDFGAVLDWAVTLRRDYYMRLNPQVIMVRAAIHPGREAYTAAHPGEFARINDMVMSRSDEPASQLTYYLYRQGGKAGIPGILKRSWADRFARMSRYELYKYRNTGIGMIDTIRICHAKGEDIDELMRTGTVQMPAEEKTWETMRAGGASWREILSTIRMGHMALLRNLRGIFREIDDREYARGILEQLKAGVPGGKQFPFRYKSAYDAVKADGDVHHRQMILDALEECIDIACGNMPRLSGRTVCLSDNSGSAWGTVTTSYGTVTIAEIDNLSSVITARNSDEGVVGKFGDAVRMFDVSQRNGVLSQAEAISRDHYSDVGGGTEGGIWNFFREAMEKGIVYDNIFIYSDQQAGHGRLRGTSTHQAEYQEAGYGCNKSNGWFGSTTYLDVAHIIDTYRRKVNPKVNVFTVQTAGYDNVLVPENGYRTSVLYGWTGSELVYADAINRFWDEMDARAEENVT